MGAAGKSGRSGIPDTERQSVWITSHTSFRPIDGLTGKKRERDTERLKKRQQPETVGESREAGTERHAQRRRTVTVGSRPM